MRRRRAWGTRFRRDDGGQMVLMAAIVLLIGLAAMAMIDARLATLNRDLDPDRRSGDDPVAHDAGVEHLLWRLNATLNVTSAAFDTELANALAHIVNLDQTSGWSLRTASQKGCADVGPDSDWTVTVDLHRSNGVTTWQWPVTSTFRVAGTNC